jgi:hypothetical protein
MGNLNKKFGDDVDYEIYNFDADELICAHHIKDNFIKNFIIKNGHKSKCKYCENLRKVIKLSEVLKLLVTGIDCLFEDANDTRYYNSEGEHGFDGDTKLLENILNDDDLGLGITDEELYDDILKYLNTSEIAYCRKDEFGDQSDYLKDLWNYFKEVVKYQARFVFYFPDTFSEYIYHNPAGILGSVQQYISDFNLFKTISTRDKLFRCVQHESKMDVKKDGERIASNPTSNCKWNNRMSPAGISMFYCSPVEDVCINEVMDFQNNKNPFYTTAYFKPKSNLKLVDLTKLPETPSIFDKENNKQREVLFFLNAFIEDLSKPINKGDEIIDYIPTQVVTEYIKFNPELEVDGISYPSSKKPDKENYVIFKDHEKSLNDLFFYANSKKTRHI